MQSVPQELSLDLVQCLGAGEGLGHVTLALLMAPPISWSRERATSALESLVAQGMAWIDEGDSGTGGAAETLYWFPSLFPGL